MNTLEFYQQAYTYDTGNNLTNLSHQANSSTWQQTLAIHPNSNRALIRQEKGVKHAKIYAIDLRTKIPYLPTEQTRIQPNLYCQING
jgi:hypothetical protein